MAQRLNTQRLKRYESSSWPKISSRDKLILAGLYLSKYDAPGLKRLGFESFSEAFNVIGYALGSKPASIKNYRDEFDPLLPNQRKGWHKRGRRDYCLEIYERFKDLDFDSFTGLIKSFVGYDENEQSVTESAEPPEESNTSFARRLITGLAAEQYFESIHRDLPMFKDYLIENMTRMGCGYDFRLRSATEALTFLAVEVKGVKDRTGNVTMTPKEYSTASKMGDRYFLFVVKNFRESPTHQMFQNPLSSHLQFKRIERVVVQSAWLTNI